MWLRIDEKVLSDERLKLLAASLGISRPEAFWRLCHVWCWLYRERGRCMQVDEVDATAEHPGFANAMVRVRLATSTPEGLRIAGCDRAKQFGAHCEEQRRKAQKRWDDVLPASLPNMPTVMPTVLPTAMPASYLSPSLIKARSPDPDPDPETPHSVPAPDHRIDARSQARAMARKEAEAWLEWFNRRFTRSFQLTPELLKQVGAILGRGWSQKPDMRGVALYLRSRWQDDEAMAPHLVPSTILRISKFAERLDLAREWDRQCGSPIWKEGAQ